MNSLRVWITGLGVLAVMAACDSGGDDNKDKDGDGGGDELASEGSSSDPLDITELLPYDGQVANDDQQGSFYCIGGLTTGTTYFVSVDNESDYSSQYVSLDVYDTDSAGTILCDSNEVSSVQSCSPIPETDTLFLAIYITSASDNGAEYEISIDPEPEGGECSSSGDFGLLAFAIAAGTSSPAEIYVYDSDGVLVAGNTDAFTGSTYYAYRMTVDDSGVVTTYTGEGEVSLPNGEYTAYITVAPDFDSSVEEGEPVYLDTFTIDGDTAVELDADGFDGAVEEDITITNSIGAFETKDAVCYFVLPGSDIEADGSQVWRYTGFGPLAGTGSEVSSGLGAFYGPMPPGEYDLYCMVGDTLSEGNPVIYATGVDYVYQSSSPVTVTGAGTTIDAGDFVAQ